MGASPAEPRVCDSEQDYFGLWNEHLGSTRGEGTGLGPTELAEVGGRLADRAAWVFIAGYQGALRQSFPALREYAGWASYVVSEARDESKAPTCHLVDTGSESYLQGTKNWVAASAHLRWLVVNAASSTAGSESTVNLLVSADANGVALIEKPSGRFLPELIVGRAEFSKVALSTYSHLDETPNFASLFGLIEARCLLVALGAHFSQVAPTDAPPGQSLMLSSGLATAELASPASIDVLLEAMALLVDWFEGWHERGCPGESVAVESLRQRWSDDQRLLQMHRPLLLRHKEQVTTKE